MSKCICCGEEIPEGRQICWQCEHAGKEDEFDPYEDDTIKFIWGVKSYDDLCTNDACLYTMNDIDICYDKKNKYYMLGIETAYMFENKEKESKYLRYCLNAFTKFMDDNGYNKDEPYLFFMCNLTTSMTANSIEELYTNFRIFVEGYCKIYGGENEQDL